MSKATFTGLDFFLNDLSLEEFFSFAKELIEMEEEEKANQEKGQDLGNLARAWQPPA